MDYRSREDWDAKPPRNRQRVATPHERAWLHHTVGDFGGPSEADPGEGDAGMRKIQRQHMNQGWFDIGYSYVFDPNPGILYEGRGAGVVGAHTEGYNHDLGLAVMGNYQERRPPEALLRGLGECLVWLRDQGVILKAEFHGGHRDTKSTLCPGAYLYREIDRINRFANNGETNVAAAISDEDIGRIAQAVWTFRLPHANVSGKVAAWQYFSRRLRGIRQAVDSVDVDLSEGDKDAIARAVAEEINRQSGLSRADQAASLRAAAEALDVE